MRQAANQLAWRVGALRACRVLGVPRSSLYRHRQPPALSPPPQESKPVPARTLAGQERRQVLDVLNSARFAWLLV
jgi:putative transposase